MIVVLEEVPPSLLSQVNLFQSIVMMRSTYPPIFPMLSQATYSIVDHLDVDKDDVVEFGLEEVPPSLLSQVKLFQSIMMMVMVVVAMIRIMVLMTMISDSCS